MTCLKTVVNYHDAQLFDFDHQIEFDDHLKLFFQNDNLWHLLKSLIRRSLVLKSWSTPAPTLVCSLEHTMIKTRKIRIHVDSVHSSQLWCDCQWKMKVKNVITNIVKNGRDYCKNDRHSHWMIKMRKISIHVDSLHTSEWGEQQIEAQCESLEATSGNLRTLLFILIMLEIMLRMMMMVSDYSDNDDYCSSYI